MERSTSQVNILRFLVYAYYSRGPLAQNLSIIHRLIVENKIQEGPFFIFDVRSVMDPLARQIFDILVADVGEHLINKETMKIFIETLITLYIDHSIVV